MNKKIPYVIRRRGKFLYQSVIENISVESVTANIFRISVLPQVALNEVMRAPLGVPNGAIQTLPVNEIFKPAEGGVDAGIKRLNVIEESFADIGDIFFGEGEEMALLIIVSVFHIEEDGQFKEDARVLDNFFTEDSLIGGVCGS